MNAPPQQPLAFATLRVYENVVRNLSNTFKVVSEFIDEAVMEFSADGLTFSRTDLAQTTAHTVDVLASEVRSAGGVYNYCTRERRTRVGIDVRALSLVLSSMTSCTCVQIDALVDRGLLITSFVSEVRKTQLEVSFIALDDDEQLPRDSPWDFDIELNSESFATSVNDLHKIIGDTQVWLMVNAHDGAYLLGQNETQTLSGREYLGGASEDAPTGGLETLDAYAMRYITFMSKATKLNKVLKLRTRQSMPLVFLLDVLGVGKLTMVIAPRHVEPEDAAEARQLARWRDPVYSLNIV
jgi:hypothetical protein